MALEQARLVSLIEFAQQSARLRAKTVSSVAGHGNFSLTEHATQGLPGIKLAPEDAESADEVWMAIERLAETRPPEVKSRTLLPWLTLAQGPDVPPGLRATVTGQALIDAGTHSTTNDRTRAAREAGLPRIQPDATIAIADYDRASAVRAAHAVYLDSRWTPWAEEERRRRKTIQLYAQLFTLKQQLEGSIVEAQLELTWGVGQAVWNADGTVVNYPLITRAVELSLEPLSGAIEIRPRDVDALLEVDWFASVDNPGVAALEAAAKEFFGKATKTFSPFDRSTFEGLLRTAATHLDPNGAYWPDHAPADDRAVPKAEGKLQVTDTWVLFARPRTNSLFLQDLEKLKKAVGKADGATTLPPAVAALVTDPATVNADMELPVFRGVSATGWSVDGGGGTPATDLYFPKAFNAEQVHIVQLLECHDGVVVQGPPGTGKTHTIANVICHYLALGKRVLVTSMKDPALAVLQEKLPKDIQPLAIALLSSEQSGMKQFEYAIQKIASEVQGLHRPSAEREIKNLEDSIDALHGKLSEIDRAITSWALKNLKKIQLDGEELDPQDAAREAVAYEGAELLIPDDIGIGEEHQPRFNDSDIVRLRDARRRLGLDIDYLGASLPQLAEFPDSRRLLQVHQDLARFTLLSQEVDSGRVPALADSSEETLTRVQALVNHIDKLHAARTEVLVAHRPWTVGMRERIRHGNGTDVLKMLEALGAELDVCIKSRQEFLARPVASPAGMETDPELMDAVLRCSEGKSPFGVAGLVGKSEQKRKLAEVRVLGTPPRQAPDWAHVAEHLELQSQLRERALRWNTLAAELGMDPVAGHEPEHGVAAWQHFSLYRKVKEVVAAEQLLTKSVAEVLPAWAGTREVVDNPTRLTELAATLHHHLTKYRLTEVWAVKAQFQQILEKRRGRIVTRLRIFIADTLGNPAVPDAQMQAAWSELMAELSRVNGLGEHLTVVTDVVGCIADSGAPQYASRMKTPQTGTVDTLLPDNWREIWRIRRLTTHLDAIDAHAELKRLSTTRSEREADLARAYQDTVVKRTWLKLAQNASPNVRAALQGYLAAIMKIGKGTGKRAVRYRQDARNAAAEANPAVPCWIMPHYRVSESLPAELGCFDLVIIDEASQSDLTALPALLRAKKVLIVGDDRQVSPEGVGLEEEKVRSLMSRFLADQVPTYRPQMSPERSIYDLFKVVFSGSGVMLKEHFRCVGPIIEYSKREFYNHELRPLRLPEASQRLDPPLVDVIIEDGYRRGDLNRAEARYIVREIEAIVADPAMAGRTIGVVSLLGEKQALHIWEELTATLGTEAIDRHHIACGDARTFQGKERDIMFLSMVSAPNEVGIALTRDTFEQRFNVAASRARDRMYLVRSVELDHLSPADRMRRGLIAHFAAPYAQDEERVDDQRKLCESPFEREVYDELVQRGFRVTPQVKAGQYRIDMVVEGANDARLAVECDGDRYHGADKWADDMQRQRTLERAGWAFWRSFASSFVRRREVVVNDLLQTLAQRGIEPTGDEGAPRSVHTEQRRVRASYDPVNT